MAAQQDVAAVVSVLVGDDSISRERERERIVNAIRTARQDVTVEGYDPERERIGDFIVRILTPSLFGGVRIFVLRHAQELGADDLDAFQQLFELAQGDEYVIMEAEEPEKTQKAFVAFVKKAQKSSTCVVREYPKPPSYRVAEWLVANTPVIFNRRITRADAEYLVDLAGDDFDTLRSELEKVDLFLEPGKPLTQAAIASVVEGTREAAGFEMAEALGRKDLTRALRILDSLFSTTFYPPACLGALLRHYWILFRIRAYAASNPLVVKDFLGALRSGDRDTQASAGLRIGVGAGILTDKQGSRVYPMLVKSGLVQQAGTYSDAHLTAIFRWLRDIDLGVKTGTVDASRTFMQLLCVRLVRGPQTPADVQAFA